MGLGLAWKAFIKAFKEPEKAQEFVNGQVVEAPKQVEAMDQTHLRLLNYLQQNGRLIDFLKEDISAFNDAQVGAAVRRIHQDCAQTLEELVTIRPLRDEKEGETVQVPRDYNPAEIKVVGQVKGEPPFTGVLVHKGWKAHKRSLPKKTGDGVHDVVYPAEIEVKA